MGTLDSKLNRQAAREAAADTPERADAWAQRHDAGLLFSLDVGAAGFTTPKRSGDDASFSALALRDRVVIMLLFDQVVREDQVQLAWQLWQQMGRDGVKEPLWRVLTLFPDLDRELVYAEAARVYGFAEARISRLSALALIKEMAKNLEANHWERLVEVRVVPVAEVMQKHSHHRRVVFATPDPTRPEIHQLLPELGLGGFELRYAREAEIVNLLVEAFPRRYNHLRGLSGVTKDFLAAVYPDEEAPPPLGITDPLMVSTVEPSLGTADSGLTLFENILVDAVRQRATDVCLLPHPNGQTDVYYQINGELLRQRIIEHIPPQMLMTGIKSSILRQSGEALILHKRLIQRWVDDALVRFRVSVVPAGEEVHSECIVVRIHA